MYIFKIWQHGAASNVACQMTADRQLMEDSATILATQDKKAF